MKMNKKLIFACIALANVLFSIIPFFTGPNINNLLNNVSNKNWRSANCKIFEDYIKHNKDTISDDEKSSYSKEKNLCLSKKAVYGLEYASFSIDLVLGFVCFILSFLQFLKIGKHCLKPTAIMGFIFGIIQFVMTFVYLFYSAFIFNNGYSTIIRLNDDGSFAQWDDSKGKFSCLYYNEEDQDSFYIKFKELNKKQYNYIKENSLEETNSKIKSCTLFNTVFSPSYLDIESYCKEIMSDNTLSQKRPKFGEKNENCDLIYTHDSLTEIYNKDIYDKWMTTLIFSGFLLGIAAALSVFGFLIVKFPDKDEVDENLKQAHIQ